MFLSRAIPSTILNNSGFGMRPLYSLAIQLCELRIPKLSFHLFDALSVFTSFLPTAYCLLPSLHPTQRPPHSRDGPLLRTNLSKCSNPHPKFLSGEGRMALAP